METIEIKCDQCRVDVTYTGNCEDYRIVLGSQSMTPWFVREGLSGGVLTSMAVRDPFPHSRHFCSETCLAVWALNKYPKPDEMLARQSQRRDRQSDQST